MHDTVNTSGLTFAKWVCAAGVAVPDYTMGIPEAYNRAWPAVAPYTISGQSVVPCAEHATCYIGKRHALKSWSRAQYPAKVRKAWRDGEDPSEWRSSHAP